MIKKEKDVYEVKESLVMKSLGRYLFEVIGRLMLSVICLTAAGTVFIGQGVSTNNIGLQGAGLIILLWCVLPLWDMITTRKYIEG